VLHGQTGWLVPPGNVETLTAQIAHALAMDDESYQQISMFAEQNASQFTSESMCDGTLRVYDEVLRIGR
jgi:glycosyltransferase involved in cell wall biosynthesis